MGITTYTKHPDAQAQAHGQLRGYVEATFDDARVVRRRVRAPGSAAWHTKADALEAEMELQQAEQDASEGADQAATGEIDLDSQPFKQAEPKRVARSICRQAMTKGTLEAYHHFIAWDGWRTRRSLNIVQAKNLMMEITDDPLTEDEWTEIKDRRAWIMNAGRAGDCAAFQAVVDGDSWAN